MHSVSRLQWSEFFIVTSKAMPRVQWKKRRREKTRNGMQLFAYGNAGPSGPIEDPGEKCRRKFRDTSLSVGADN
jgi:hypothetical protein